MILNNIVIFCFVLLLIFTFSLMGGCNSCRVTPVKIVCIGDSLTACGGEGGHYTDWLAVWLGDNVIVINKGIGGDTLDGGRARFEKDVIELKPGIVVIALGANDFWRELRSIGELKADLEDMVVRSKAIGAKVVIASCFGDRDLTAETHAEFDSSKYSFADEIALMEKEICRSYGCYYVPNMQIDIKPNGKEPYWSDSNHPNKAGNEFVARRIYGQLRLALNDGTTK